MTVLTCIITHAPWNRCSERSLISRAHEGSPHWCNRTLLARARNRRHRATSSKLRGYFAFDLRARRESLWLERLFTASPSGKGGRDFCSRRAACELPTMVLFSFVARIQCRAIYYTAKYVASFDPWPGCFLAGSCGRDRAVSIQCGPCRFMSYYCSIFTLRTKPW